MLRTVIVNFTGDRSNWGCQATSWELLKLLHKAFADRLVIPFDFVPLFPRHQMDFDVDQQFGDAIRSAMASESLSPEQSALLVKVAEQRYGALFEKIRYADLVVFQAEGTLTGSDMLHGWRLLLLPFIAKKVFGKVVLSLNQTIFWKNSNIDTYVVNAFNSFDFVAVREPSSLAYIRAAGVGHAGLIPDAAFLTQAMQSGYGLPELVSEKKYFAVTGSAALDFFSVESMFLVIEQIRDRFGLSAVFICSAASDLKLIKMARERWGPDVLYVQASANYRAVADVIRQCEFLFGGRYHMAILAATVYTPMVLLPSNTPKNEGLLALLDYPLDVRRIEDKATILDDVQRIIESPVDFKSVLKRGMTRILSLIDEGMIAMQRALDNNTSFGTITDVPVRAVVAENTQDYYYAIIANQSRKYKYPQDASKALPAAPPMLTIIVPLIACLRRNIDTEINMLLLRHAVEAYTDEICKQLNARWLVSICDTYADFGTEIEKRNAFLISMLVNFEKVAQSYAYWRLGYPETLDVTGPMEHRKIPLWDGMTSFHLVIGDVTNNMFGRLTELLKETPVFEKIFKRIVQGLATQETILGTLNKHHGHVFETDYSWIAEDKYSEWRKNINPTKYQHTFARGAGKK